LVNAAFDHFIIASAFHDRCFILGDYNFARLTEEIKSCSLELETNFF